MKGRRSTNYSFLHQRRLLLLKRQRAINFGNERLQRDGRLEFLLTKTKMVWADTALVLNRLGFSCTNLRAWRGPQQQQSLVTNLRTTLLYNA